MFSGVPATRLLSGTVWKKKSSHNDNRVKPILLFNFIGLINANFNIFTHFSSFAWLTPTKFNLFKRCANIVMEIWFSAVSLMTTIIKTAISY